MRGAVVALLSTTGLASFGCAHAGARGSERSLSVGRYTVESIRSRATLDGVDQLLEISEEGSKMVDAGGGEHILTQRGALTLSSNGSCRLALAVSVDGEEPGISDRTCTWAVDGDQFFLGDGRGDQGTRTIYKVQRTGEKLVLEGLVDIGPDGKVVGNATGERIVLVERPQQMASRPVDRTAEPASSDLGDLGSDL